MTARLCGRRAGAWRALAAVVAVLAAGACTEHSTGEAACPLLCPEQGVAVEDTVLSAIVVDTALSPLPPIGTEGVIILASRGDTLETGAVLRFDTLIADFPFLGGSDTTTHHIVAIDSARLTLQVAGIELAPDPVTIDVYNVDTAAADLDLAADRALFRPDRLLASTTFTTDTIAGIITIPLPTDSVQTRLLAGRRLRLGLRVRSTGPVQLTIFAAPLNVAAAATIRYRATSDATTPDVPDTLALATVVGSHSFLEPGPGAPDLADYTLVFRGTPGPSGDTLVVGGLPASRVYMRFDLPPAILDSATVIRATLILTQIPNPTTGADSLGLLPRLVLAAPFLDPGRSALLLQNVELNPLPASVLQTVDSGEVRVELVNATRLWATQDPAALQRAIVLQSADEGAAPRAVYFYSSEAPVDSLRPRLRIDFIAHTRNGLP